MRQFRNLIFDVTIHAFDTSSAVRLRSSPNLPPDRIFVLPFPVTLTTLTLNQRSSRWFGNYFWKSSPEGPPPSFPQLRAKTSCSRGTPELASGKAYEGRKDLGNTQSGDGMRYKGRGLIQLTGRANYTECQKTSSLVAELNVDVVLNPDLIAKDDQLCADVASWFWDRRELNSLADRDNLDAITQRIYGGLNGLSDRRRLLIRSKTLLGI